MGAQQFIITKTAFAFFYFNDFIPNIFVFASFCSICTYCQYSLKLLTSQHNLSKMHKTIFLLLILFLCVECKFIALWGVDNSDNSCNDTERVKIVVTWQTRNYSNQIYENLNEFYFSLNINLVLKNISIKFLSFSTTINFGRYSKNIKIKERQHKKDSKILEDDIFL